MRKIGSVLSFLLIIKTIFTQDFNVSLNDFLLLNLDNAGIVTISNDFHGNYLISFTNGELRKYTFDFSSYTNINVPQTVEVISKKYLEYDVELSDNTTLSLLGLAYAFRSNSLKRIRNYEYYSFNQLQRINMNETIIQQFGYAINVSNIIKTAQTIFLKTQMLIVYRGNFHSFKYNPILGLNSSLEAAMAYQMDFYQQIDHLNIIQNCYISLDNTVYSATITIYLSYNFTIGHFDMSQQPSINYTQIYNSPTPITSLFASNGILMMQSNTSGITNIYDIDNADKVGSVSGIPLDQTFRFFYIYDSFYILQSKGLIKLDYDSSNLNLSFNSLVANLPFNTYKLVLNSFSHIFYIPGLPYIYKAGQCLGQSQNINGTCIDYSCSVVNCSYCPFSSLMCSVCIHGFRLDSNYSCQIVNSTTEPNIQSFINILIQYFKKILTLLISVPGARRIVSPIFYYFGIFDDIYFYQFHNRLYSSTMSSAFDSINDIQNKKWSIVNYSTVLNWLLINQTVFNNSTDYKELYDTYNIIQSNHTDSEGLWGNCQDFFIIALPITIAGFIIGRLLFKMLFRFRISKLFRKFYFWPILFLLLLDGNIQQFAFYQATEWKNMFFFSFGSKSVKFQTIIFGFVLVFISIALYALSYSFYLKLSSYLMDNNKSTKMGYFSLTFQFGLRNLYLGLIHNILRAVQQKHMLITLLLSQMAFIILFVVSISMKNYLYDTKIWIYVLLNFLKSILVFTFLFQLNEPIIEIVQQQLLFLIIILFFVGCLLQTYLLAKQIVQGTINLLCSKKKIQTQLPQSKELKHKNSSRFKPNHKVKVQFLVQKNEGII